MTRNLLFAACLLALALTFIAMRHPLMNAAPDVVPPLGPTPPLDQTAARLASITSPARYALAAQHYVALAGADSGDCTNVSTPCRTVQYAVDRAAAGDEILVATGVYTNQVVYVGKTVTIRGGYAAGNWTLSDPAANPTTLDAQGQGPVLYIAGNISPTIESLRLTGGRGHTFGGGVYVMNAAATISNCRVFGNSATVGGGLYLSSSASTLKRNIIVSNSASQGGGLYLYSSAATLDGNVISSNAAAFEGGGLYLYTSDATLVNNVVTDNQADSSGSGIYVYSAAPRLLHTTLARNMAAGHGDGSGIHVAHHPSLLYSTVGLTNTILVSQTVGVTVTAGNMVTFNGVLWYGNDVDINGAGTISVTNAHTGDPAFASDGYHLTAVSAAIDRGVDSGVTTDLDGDARPQGNGYDWGADEYLGATGVIEPDLGGTIIYTNSQGLTTTIVLPSGAVTETIVLVYTPVPLSTEPVSPGLRFVGQAFDLDAYRNGVRLVRFAFEKPITVTIRYSDTDVVGIDEPTVALYRWVPPWEIVGTRPGEAQTLNIDNNVLTAWLRGLTRFRWMGEGEYEVFLPVVFKSG